MADVEYGEAFQSEETQEKLVQELNFEIYGKQTTVDIGSKENFTRN